MAFLRNLFLFLPLALAAPAVVVVATFRAEPGWCFIPPTRKQDRNS